MLYGYIKDLKDRVKYPIRVSNLEMVNAGESIRGNFYVDYYLTPDLLDPVIKKVIFNPPATVLLWSDGSKTVVKCGEQDEFDPEKGLVMAITKKLFGGKGNYYNKIKNLLENAVYQYDKDDVYDLNIPRTVVKRLRNIETPNSTIFNAAYYECPLCGDEILKSGARYCANCGQRLIWEEK